MTEASLMGKAGIADQIVAPGVNPRRASRIVWLLAISLGLLMTGFAITQDRAYVKDDEQKVFTSFFDCEAWGMRIPTMREGEIVTVIGRLREDRWEGSDGHWKSRLKLIVKTVKKGAYDANMILVRQEQAITI